MHVTVRPLRPSDASTVLALINANAVRFAKGGLVRLPWHTRGFDEFIATQPGSSAVFGIFDSAAPVGLVGFDVVRVGAMTAPGVGVWYGIDAAYEGKGLVTSAIRESLNSFAMEVPRVETVVVHCSARNRKSARVAEALGMRLDPATNYIRQTSCRSRQSFLGFSAPMSTVLSSESQYDVPATPEAPRRMKSPSFNRI